MSRIERMGLLLHYKKTAKAFCMFKPKDGRWLSVFRVPCQSYFLHHCILFLYSATVDKAGKLHPCNKIHKDLPTYQPAGLIAAEQYLLARPEWVREEKWTLFLQRAAQQNTERRDWTFCVAIICFHIFCAYHPGHLLKEGTLCFIGYVVDKWVRVDTAWFVLENLLFVLHFLWICFLFLCSLYHLPAPHPCSPQLSRLWFPFASGFMRILKVYFQVPAFSNRQWYLRYGLCLKTVNHHRLNQEREVYEIERKIWCDFK